MTTAPTPGWTGHIAVDSALVMLDRIDCSPDDDARIDAITATLRQLHAAYQALQTENERLQMELVAEARAAAEQQLRADQLAQQHRMQAQMHEQATQQLTELEARKPLPLSDEQLRAEFIPWAEIQYRHEDEFSKRDFKICLAAWSAGRRTALVDKSPNLQEPLVDKTANLQDRPTRKPLPPMEAIKLGMEAQQACRPHSTGTTNWAAAMTRFYERRLCGITGGSS